MNYEEKICLQIISAGRLHHVAASRLFSGLQYANQDYGVEFSIKANDKVYSKANPDHNLIGDLGRMPKGSTIEIELSSEEPNKLKEAIDSLDYFIDRNSLRETGNQ